MEEYKAGDFFSSYEDITENANHDKKKEPDSARMITRRAGICPVRSGSGSRFSCSIMKRFSYHCVLHGVLPFFRTENWRD